MPGKPAGLAGRINAAGALTDCSIAHLACVGEINLRSELRPTSGRLRRRPGSSGSLPLPYSLEAGND